MQNCSLTSEYKWNTFGNEFARKDSIREREKLAWTVENEGNSKTGV